jgi:DNA/RNA-binding domain of Phe-tRNA-synthetase-like protein
VVLAEHPLLEAACFAADLPSPLGEIATPPPILDLLKPAAVGPFASDDALRTAVRDLLRVGGFKPTGRSKPASEYLIRAVSEGALGPINPVVDICNAASLHSGLPISVVDLDRAVAPFRVDVAPAGTAYVFNAGGQVLDVGGLLCLLDAEGPCANAVKDSQRTKTSAGTRRVLAVIWGTTARPGLARQVANWYRKELENLGATTRDA